MSAPKSLFSFVQTGTRSRPWHVVSGPGIVKSPLDVTACGERGSTVNNAYGELPRFAKLCEKCQRIMAVAAVERELPPADLWSALHKIAYSRGGQYELITTLRNVAREAIEARTPDASPPRDFVAGRGVQGDVAANDHEARGSST